MATRQAGQAVGRYPGIRHSGIRQGQTRLLLPVSGTVGQPDIPAFRPKRLPSSATSLKCSLRHSFVDQILKFEAAALHSIPLESQGEAVAILLLTFQRVIAAPGNKRSQVSSRGSQPYSHLTIQPSSHPVSQLDSRAKSQALGQLLINSTGWRSVMATKTMQLGEQKGKQLNRMIATLAATGEYPKDQNVEQYVEDELYLMVSLLLNHLLICKVRLF